MNIWKGETNIPIRKSRFYGTATNVEAYANQLKRNGYRYTTKDGKTYQSGAYSAVHKADFVGNKWLLGLVGSNEVTGGDCWSCYSHSSYFAEAPDPTSNTELYQDFKRIWGTFDGINNRSQPNLVLPKKVKDGELYEKNAY